MNIKIKIEETKKKNVTIFDSIQLWNAYEDFKAQNTFISMNIEISAEFVDERLIISAKEYLCSNA